MSPPPWAVTDQHLPVPSSLPAKMDVWPRRLQAFMLNAYSDWQRIFLFGAMAMVLLLSPAAYDPPNRRTMAALIHRTSWQVLPWFSLLAGLVSLVLIRVVLVTALHYGLQRFALDLMVRVLVLEVIPLFAALYVALRYALTASTDVHGLIIPRDLDRLGGVETDRIRDELVPSVVAYAVSVLTMVVVSGLLTLLMAYWSVYGFSRWGLAEFARTVGQAFDLVTSLVFMLKVFLMSMAVAVIPLAASLGGKEHFDIHTRLQPGAMRLFVVLFVIEGATLALRYA